MTKKTALYNRPRRRSEYWLRISINEDDSFNLYTHPKFTEIINYHFPLLKKISTTKWKKGQKPETVSLWIKADQRQHFDLENFQNWAEFACSQSIWLGLKNLKDHFSGDELKFCIAADINMKLDENGDKVLDQFNQPKRTSIGELEYQLKYNRMLKKHEYEDYLNTMCFHLQNIYSLLPIKTAPVIITPIPVTLDERFKLSWVLSKSFADKLDLEFLNPELLLLKGNSKALNLNSKIQQWKNIYETPSSVTFSEDIVDKTVTIIDDLYQSGATIWSYAKYLKSQGAKEVFGLTCVKSLGNRDNISWDQRIK